MAAANGTSVIQSPRFTNDYEFGINVSTYQ